MSVKHPSIRVMTTATTLRAIAVAAAIVLLVWLLADVLLLIFTAVLIAMIIRGITNCITRWTGVHDAVAFSAVTILMAVSLAGLVYYLGPPLVTQGQQLWDNLHQQYHKLEQAYGNTPLGNFIVEKFSPSTVVNSKIMHSTAAVVTSTASDLMTAFVLTVTAIYFALSPELYVRGMVALVPVSYRSRARAILGHVGTTLSWWLIGQCIDMLVVGVMSAVGLSVLGVPMALALAVLAGLLTFVPYFGAIAAAVPAVMVSLTVSWHLALWALLVFACCHAVEGYIIAPLVQRRTVHLPPAVMILSMMILGSIAGPMGIVLGTPIAAALLVVVREAYVEDVLHARSRLHEEAKFPTDA